MLYHVFRYYCCFEAVDFSFLNQATAAPPVALGTSTATAPLPSTADLPVSGSSANAAGGGVVKKVDFVSSDTQKLIHPEDDVSLVRLSPQVALALLLSPFLRVDFFGTHSIGSLILGGPKISTTRNSQRIPYLVG